MPLERLFFPDIERCSAKQLCAVVHQGSKLGTERFLPRSLVEAAGSRASEVQHGDSSSSCDKRFLPSFPHRFLESGASIKKIFVPQFTQ